MSTFFTIAGANHSHATRFAGPSDQQISGLNLAVHPSRSTQLDVRRYFFSQRVVNEWNALPTYVKHARNVNDFKNKYDKLSAKT